MEKIKAWYKVLDQEVDKCRRLFYDIQPSMEKE
jgi:hypothetical protein